ncbi:hypothetical protein TrLO_g14838 [Triparma laevis f. longispina]|uniref:Transmembrane protein n=1 Tax=Triparma laevis f. longispina TaxID=1714387 RepID=A0A9W7L0B4_9STRA|nr:hypothetical protein TrLO_g14838 [Triparma laevis f. longispina]
MDKQTKLKQTTTVVQVLSEASKFNNLPYPRWFISFSLFGSFFTMLFQPHPACLTDFELPSYVNGIIIFITLELLIRFLLARFLRTHSAIDEKSVSDKIEAMMNTKDVIERWELERTLNWDLMTEEEQARWKVNANHKHPSRINIFGLVLACFCGVMFLFLGFFLAIIPSASNSWAQCLWFSADMLGGVSVDAYAVQCLSCDGGDIIHSYLRGLFRSTSRQAAEEEEEVEEVEAGEETKDDDENDEENPVELVTSPVHTHIDEQDQIIELSEVKKKKEKQQNQPQNHPKRPSMIKTQSSKPSTSEVTLTKRIESKAAKSQSAI